MRGGTCRLIGRYTLNLTTLNLYTMLFNKIITIIMDIGFKNGLGTSFTWNVLRYKTTLSDLITVITKWSTLIAKASQSGFQDVLNLFYVFGFFDGEGCVYGAIHRRYDTKYGYNTVVGISFGQAKQREYLLVFVQKILGVGIISNLGANYKQLHIRNLRDVKCAASILLLGCKAKQLQIKLVLFLVDNWTGMAGNPVNFLRNCYIVEHIQSLNDQADIAAIHSPADVKLFMLSQGFITEQQAVVAYGLAQDVISKVVKG